MTLDDPVGAASHMAISDRHVFPESINKLMR